MAENTDSMPNGAAAAALVAAGVGCFVVGVLTTGAEMVAALKDALNWYNPVGPLSGKTTLGVIAWLIAWAILHFVWRDKDVNFRRVYVVTLALVAIGFLFTFPIFFEAFAAE